jgi:hypothetical protein
LWNKKTHYNISYKQCGISAKPKSSCIFTRSPKLFGDSIKKETKEQKFWLIAGSKIIAFLPRTAHSRDVSGQLRTTQHKKDNGT